LVAGYEKILSTVELILSCRGQDFHVSTEGKGIHVVGSTSVGATHQVKGHHMEIIQEVFREEIHN
jgi:hypothetical protein